MDRQAPRLKVASEGLIAESVIESCAPRLGGGDRKVTIENGRDGTIDEVRDRNSISESSSESTRRRRGSLRGRPFRRPRKTQEHILKWMVFSEVPENRVKLEFSIELRCELL